MSAMGRQQTRGRRPNADFRAPFLPLPSSPPVTRAPQPFGIARPGIPPTDITRIRSRVRWTDEISHLPSTLR